MPAHDTRLPTASEWERHDESEGSCGENAGTRMAQAAAKPFLVSVLLDSRRRLWRSAPSMPQNFDATGTSQETLIAALSTSGRDSQSVSNVRCAQLRASATPEKKTPEMSTRDHRFGLYTSRGLPASDQALTFCLPEALIRSTALHTAAVFWGTELASSVAVDWRIGAQAGRVLIPVSRSCRGDPRTPWNSPPPSSSEGKPCHRETIMAITRGQVLESCLRGGATVPVH
jgi:hypothetical protein